MEAVVVLRSDDLLYDLKSLSYEIGRNAVFSDEQRGAIMDLSEDGVGRDASMRCVQGACSRLRQFVSGYVKRGMDGSLSAGPSCLDCEVFEFRMDVPCTFLRDGVRSLGVLFHEYVVRSVLSERLSFVCPDAVRFVPPCSETLSVIRSVLCSRKRPPRRCARPF